MFSEPTTMIQPPAVHSDGTSDRADGNGQDAAQTPAQLEAENHGLRAENARLRQLLNSATDYAVITLDLAGRINGWNTGARAVLGYADGEILGRSGEVFFPAEDRAEGVFTAELCRAMEAGRATNERWHLRRDGSRFWASGSMMPLLGDDGQVEGFLNVFRDNTAMRAEMERRALLLAEMGHRIKNTLATVQAVATQTLRSGGVSEEVQEIFAARLLALARSHDLLIRNQWDGAPLTEVVERALLPYDGATRASLQGPPVWLPGGTVEMLSLAFHELATNAAKYGALSVAEGRIEVSWSLRQARDGTRLAHLVWREQDGPAVVPPRGQGFGSKLLQQGLVQSLGGTVTLDFRPEGLECRICLPVVPAPGRDLGKNDARSRQDDASGAGI